jgi:ribosomal protein S25
MKKVNFKEIIIKDINDNNIVTDFQKQLGNQLYMQGQNIEECELGKKIYFTPDDEATELDDKEVAIVRKAVQGYSYVARTSIEQALG